jgi:hypothetical protein
MKRLTPIPPDSVAKLKSDSETGIGYQVVSVTLKDGRNFDQAVASEGYVIQVRGYEDVPFTQVDRLPLQLNTSGPDNVYKTQHDALGKKP